LHLVLNPMSLSKEVFFKVQNSDRTHHGFTYVDGFNELPPDEKFESDPKKSCCPGGLYITNDANLKKFLSYGNQVSIVELPFDNPKFQIVADPSWSYNGYSGHIQSVEKWRVNMLNLCERFSTTKSDDVDKIITYAKTIRQIGTPTEKSIYLLSNDIVDLSDYLMIIDDSFMIDIKSHLSKLSLEGQLTMLKHRVIDQDKRVVIAEHVYENLLKENDFEVYLRLVITGLTNIFDSEKQLCITARLIELFVNQEKSGSYLLMLSKQIFDSMTDDQQITIYNYVVKLSALETNRDNIMAFFTHFWLHSKKFDTQYKLIVETIFNKYLTNKQAFFGVPIDVFNYAYKNNIPSFGLVMKSFIDTEVNAKYFINGWYNVGQYLPYLLAFAETPAHLENVGIIVKDFWSNKSNSISYGFSVLDMMKNLINKCVGVDKMIYHAKKFLAQESEVSFSNYLYEHHLYDELIDSQKETHPVKDHLSDHQLLKLSYENDKPFFPDFLKRLLNALYEPQQTCNFKQHLHAYAPYLYKICPKYSTYIRKDLMDIVLTNIYHSYSTKFMAGISVETFEKYLDVYLSTNCGSIDESFSRYLHRESMKNITSDMIDCYNVYGKMTVGLLTTFIAVEPSVLIETQAFKSHKTKQVYKNAILAGHLEMADYMKQTLVF
jgi:hypothetical protein